MRTAYIVDAVRTPVGRYGGMLASIRPDDLAAEAIKGLLARNVNVPTEAIEDVILGAANQAGEDNRNVARMAGLLAGIPLQAGGVTVNRLCGSGLQAIMQAANAIAGNMGDVFIAGGVESMTRAPFVMGKQDSAFGRSAEIYDTTMGWRFVNPSLSSLYHPFTMGETAENVAERYHISREAQDAWGLRSQELWAKAHEAGRFKDEIVPILIPQKKSSPIIFATDEHPRATSMDALEKLKPAFRNPGTVTAGNSSGINDGAAMTLVVSEEALKLYNLKPMARIVTGAVAGVDPAVMGIGPVPASEKAMKRAGLVINDFDVIELNEAFAAQVLASKMLLGIEDDSNVNVNGGSIAIGHPLGASGARISATLLHELKRNSGRYGLATMCIGVGQGIAVIYENLL
jgi:acetyl-CoA C-acetyltransferase